jgi:hypothetical protein
VGTPSVVSNGASWCPVDVWVMAACERNSVLSSHRSDLD